MNAPTRTLFHASVICLVHHQNQFLILKRRDNDIWCLPGGHIDGDESVDDALARELYEEAGMTSSHTTCIGAFTGVRNGNKHLDVVYIVNPMHVEPSIGHQFTDWRYDSIEHLMQYTMRTVMYRALECAVHSHIL